MTAHVFSNWHHHHYTSKRTYFKRTVVDASTSATRSSTSHLSIRRNEVERTSCTALKLISSRLICSHAIISYPREDVDGGFSKRGSIIAITEFEIDSTNVASRTVSIRDNNFDAIDGVSSWLIRNSNIYWKIVSGESIKHLKFTSWLASSWNSYSWTWSRGGYIGWRGCGRVSGCFGW